MRRPRGALLPPIDADRVRGRDLYRVLRGAVLDGTLPGGEQLPSTRAVGRDYRVSRGMAEQVYAQLVDEGFLERAIGRGTFVSARVPVARRNGVSARSLPISRRGRAAASSAACREPGVLRPFNAGTADTREFPWKGWQRLQARAARELGRGALDFADPRGLPALRAAIARYLAQFRGVACEPGQVVVFNSSQQALFALFALLLDWADPVWLEDPCYLGARAALAFAGAEIVPVAVDEHGLRVADGLRRAPRARLAYVTPSHQYPTGAALSLERRVALIDWAAKRGAWIVEDDYDSEFRYAGQPLAPLWSLDPRARVIYLGTLSKVVFVSLRLAYVVVPKPLVEPLANLRTQLDGFTPPLVQATTSLFMDEGHLPTYVRRMRAVYGAKRAALIGELASLASRGWTWTDNAAGLHLLVRHASAAHVRAVARASGLSLALLSDYRSRRGSDDGLLLRYGGLDPEQVRAGARALVAAERRVQPP
jgi:GntR family transcriptional regulator/MocR family aminotransferase